MKNFACVYKILLVSTFVWSIGSQAQTEEAMGVVTGSVTGTYIKFGQDMAEMAKKEGLELAISKLDRLA